MIDFTVRIGVLFLIFSSLNFLGMVFQERVFYSDEASAGAPQTFSLLMIGALCVGGIIQPYSYPWFAFLVKILACSAC